MYRRYLLIQPLSFVLTVDSKNLNNKLATHMRTYQNPRVAQSCSEHKIWQAARATTAAPTYFPRMELDGCEYIDGGVGYNNPILMFAYPLYSHQLDID
jgi:patatin-like phospholipase/acyl hydrolase